MAHGYGPWLWPMVMAGGSLAGLLWSALVCSGLLWSALAGGKMNGKKNAGGSISIRHFCLAGLRNLRGTRLGAN